MAQATNVQSTNTPAVPTRRRFLSTAAGIAAGGTVLALATIPPALAAAAPAGPLDGASASPARALDDAGEAWKSVASASVVSWRPRGRSIGILRIRVISLWLPYAKST
jgi:hypothetical protein